MSEATCAPLCAASRVYIRPQWWQHETSCPVRIEFLARKRAALVEVAEHDEIVLPSYPAYVEYTVRCNVENEVEFQSIREGIGSVARSWSTLRLHGDEAAVQVLYRKRPGVRPIASDPQEPPPFTFERMEGPT